MDDNESNVQQLEDGSSDKLDSNKGLVSEPVQEELDNPDVPVRSKNPPITRLRQRSDTVRDELSDREKYGDEGATKIKELVALHVDTKGMKGKVTAMCISCKYDPHARGTFRQQISACKYTACPLYDVRPTTTNNTGVAKVEKPVVAKVQVKDIKGFDKAHPLNRSVHRTGE